MATIFSASILVLLTAIAFKVSSLPLEPLPGKSGEDQVKEAVHRAELAARKAALENGNSAELRVAAIKARLAAQHAIKERARNNMKLSSKLKSLRKWGHASPLKSRFRTYSNFSPYLHRRLRRPKHRNRFSNMISLNDLASDAGAQNNYQEDTTLEDRLALEAEEDKKYGAVSDNGYYGTSRADLTGQDATQSIQNQVASESARELKEIQQQINAESQNSLGKTTIGQSAAMFQGNRLSQPQAQQKPQARNGMSDVQSDLNSAMNNAEGMNAETNLLSPQITNNAENDVIGANSFTGLGEEKQPEEVGMNMPGMTSLPGQTQSETDQMGEGQASMEGPPGDSAQSAAAALATGAGQGAFSNPEPETPNGLGSFGGPGTLEGQDGPRESMGPVESGVSNGSPVGGMMPSENMEGNAFSEGDSKKSKINSKKLQRKRQ